MGDYELDNLTLNGFNEFKGKRKTSATDPRIVIGKGGRISINKVAYKKYFEKFKHVRFHYNPKKRIIAMELVDEATDNSYDIRESPKSKVAGINCLAFLKHNKIDTEVRHETEFVGTGDNNRLVFIRIKD